MKNDLIALLEAQIAHLKQAVSDARGLGVQTGHLEQLLSQTQQSIAQLESEQTEQPSTSADIIQRDDHNEKER